MEQAKDVAKAVLAVFGIAVGATVLPMAIGWILMKLTVAIGALLIAHPTLSVTAIIAFVKAMRSGKSAESAALEAGVEGAAKEALEKLFGWLQHALAAAT